MSKDIVNLITRYVRNDNDEKISFNDFIVQLKKYKLSSTDINLDSTICQTILAQINSQYEYPIKMYYSKTDEYLFNNKSNAFLKNKTIDITIASRGYYNIYYVNITTETNNGIVNFNVFENVLKKIMRNILNGEAWYLTKLLLDLFDKSLLTFIEENDITLRINDIYNLMISETFYVGGF